MSMLSPAVDATGLFLKQTHRRLTRGVPPVLITAPTDYPCTVDEAKLAARITGDEENSLIQEYIYAATEAVQLDAEIALITQTRAQYLDDFPAGCIELRMPPVQSVSSISYVDTNGSTQTFAASSYQSDLTSRPGLILPVFGQYWPVARPQLKAVTVTFVCGYGAPSTVPYTAKHAIYLRVAASYRDREMTTADEDRYWNLIDKLRWRKF